MHDWIKYRYKHLKRLPMTFAIRTLAEWTPLEKAEPGYTIIVGCMQSLAPIAIANMRLIEQMEHDNLHEVILVFDCEENEIPDDIKKSIAGLRARMKVRLVGYSKKQAAVTSRIKWGWVYAWLSWCIGISTAKTKHVILHDLDAMPLSSHMFEKIYSGAVESGAQFHGIQQRMDYPNPEKNVLAATFELVIDIEYLRNNFRPFDVFNKIRTIDGRYVDFDTFLYIQWKSPDCMVTQFEENGLVHPSQLICSYIDFIAGRKSMVKKSHSLLILPYFYHLGGNEHLLNSIQPHLSNYDAKTVPFEGKDLPIEGVAPKQMAWIEKQIRRLELALFGETRDEVELYLTGIIFRAGEHRTVGREKGEQAVLNL